MGCPFRNLAAGRPHIVENGSFHGE
jgi:hypothetical protein